MSEVMVRATQQAVEDLTAYLINSGAEHYIEDHYTMKMDVGTESGVVITVQYTDKASAHELRLLAEAERDEARRVLGKCQEMLDPHRDAVLWGEVVRALGISKC